MPEQRYPALPILLIDDESAWLRSIDMALARGGIDHVLACRDSREVLPLLARQEVGVIVLDMIMPHLSGEKLLPQIVREHPEIPVIILTGLNQVETSVRCMKEGAFDYFVKSVEEERLVAGVRRAIRMRELQQENDRLSHRLLQEGPPHPEAFSAIATAEPKMLDIFRYIEAVASSTQPVLITGESGTGKELIARAVHRLGHPDGPWVAVNVAGIDDHVFSDTLFGHLRGAFTGAERPRRGMVEQAERGILFLDEIGDLAPASQVKLLRLLQEREYYPLGSDTPRHSTARIVLATNQDLAGQVAAGRFRKDLFFRLRTHQVHLPPLRERRGDLPLLVGRFLQGAAGELGKKVPTPPPELLTLLSTYPFPGNVRELEAMVFEAVSLHRSGKLSTEPFRKAIGGGPGSLPPLPDDGAPPLTFGERLPTLQEAADLLVTEALRRAENNQTIAAGLLGISRPALSKRLKKKTAGETGDS